METIQLPNGKRTTRLAFGCGRILPETKRLIEVAYDAGIRHFDVAPSYGRGMSESLLGDILHGKADAVSVTTKYGIKPPVANPSLANLARSTLRPIVRRLPGVRRHINARLATNTRQVELSVAELKGSLERSLRVLKRDRIDLYLLHEVTADAITDSELVRFLQQCVEKGVIGAFGVGGERSHIDALWRRYPECCRVLQYEWSPIEAPEPFSPDLALLFRTMAPAQRIRALFSSGTLGQKQWSESLGIDAAAPGALERLLLKLTFDTRKETIILFSSLKEQNIRENVAAVMDNTLMEPAQRLMALILQTRGFLRN